MNKSQLSIGLFSFVLFSLWGVGCGNKQSEKVPDAASIDMKFNQLFERSGGGFTGGDGTYSVLLPDGRTVWIFGDTFLGEVTDRLTREKTSPVYIRNCFVVQNKGKMNTLHQGMPEEFKSMIIPPELSNSTLDKSEKDVWYWPGDGYVEGDTLNVFVSKFHQLDTGMWDFEFQSTAIARFTLPELSEFEILDIPLSSGLDIHYGHAVCKTDDFLYIYGLGKGGVYVARVQDIKDDWEFYSNGSWNSNKEEAKPMILIDGSEQFSVFKWDDKYVYITQLGGFGKEIYSYTSNTPYGSWGNKSLLYTTPLPYDSTGLFTYNAVAHPQFTINDELLISYNTNSMKLSDHFKNAGIYRPRFIRVKKHKILKN